MDLKRLRALVAAPMASLFLILALCSFAVLRPGSVGMSVPQPKVLAVPFKDCDFLSERSIVVQLHEDGSTWINGTKESPQELRSVLAEIYQYCNEKFICLVSDPDVSFGEFVYYYSAVASSTNDLHIVLRTRQPGVCRA
jgi:biopolymer transport protein ExbD